MHSGFVTLCTFILAISQRKQIYILVDTSEITPNKVEQYETYSIRCKIIVHHRLTVLVEKILITPNTKYSISMKVLLINEKLFIQIVTSFVRTDKEFYE
jgi:hypothetical protein